VFAWVLKLTPGSSHCRTGNFFFMFSATQPNGQFWNVDPNFGHSSVHCASSLNSCGWIKYMIISVYLSSLCGVLVVLMQLTILFISCLWYLPVGNFS
jgi:hypothetical protein